MNSTDGRHLSPELLAEESRRETLPAGTMIGRYRITALIASGGMGDVYRAHDERLERNVALKVLPASLTNDKERVQRFAQEARAASGLNHPNIVTIYEIGEARPSFTVQPIAKEHRQKQSDVHYIAMELVEGHTLREFLHSAPTLRAKLDVLIQIGEGLGKAHAAGIVHRDLKPDNIMVTDEGYAKIVDFGLAKLIELPRGWNPTGADSPTMRAITQQGELIGTAGYMSPEQILGKPVDPRSDIFSFGCIVFEAMTGEKPFQGDSFVDTLHCILHGQPHSLADFRRDIPAEMQRIVNKSLVKDREERYQSIRDLSIDLRVLARDLDSGIGAFTSYPARRSSWSRSRQWMVVIPVVITILAALGIPAVNWFRADRTTGTQPAASMSVGRPALQRLTTGGRTTHHTISPDGQFVAYTMRDGESAGLWLYHVPTGSRVNVVPPANQAWFAGVAFAPDGHHLLFTRYDASIYGGVFEVPLLGGSPAKLVHDVDSAVTFSPDGRQMAFVRDDFDRNQTQLFVTARDGSKGRIIATFDLPQRAVSPAWSPDGAMIAVVRGEDIWIVTLASAQKRKLPVPSWRGRLRGVTWATDGKSLIADGSNERSAGHFQLMRIDYPAGTVSSLTDDFDDYAEPRSSGSTLTALQVKRQSNVWSVPLNGTTKQITHGLGTSDGLGGAIGLRDGRMIFSSSASGTLDLWIADKDGGNARQLTRDPASEIRPMLTPDEKSVLYVSRSERGASIWKMNADGSNRIQLTAGPADYEFTLSPDGKTLFYGSLDEKNNKYVISRIPVDGGTPATLALVNVHLSDLRVTPDGKDVLFTSFEEMLMGVFKVPAAGGPAVRVTTARAYDPEVSPDGKYFACAYEYDEKMSAKLAVIPVSGGEPARILPIRGWKYQWTPDGKAITYAKIEGNRENLYLQPLSGGAARPLTSFQEGFIANYEWSKDGKTVLLTHFVENTDVVRLATK